MHVTPTVAEISLTEMADGLARGRATSEALTTSYLRRIDEIDPRLRSVLSLNPNALDEGRAADARRARKQPLSVLDGLPILVKDNIDVAGLATTAGSLALIRNIPAADAPAIQSLRQAGLTVIGKANLSEWANFRSPISTSGWSAVGGLTRNPHDLMRSACGSSSGSAAAVAASLVPAAIGTETDGSIVWPAAICGIVGLKPTRGLISRRGVVPISQEQDTVGPLTRDVRDSALVLGALCGRDTHYANGLDRHALKGVRLGALRNLPRFGPETLSLFEAALEALRAQGATIVDVDFRDLDLAPLMEKYLPALLTEFKAGINAYLVAANPAVETRSLADLIAFNRAEPRELEWFGQEYFELAQQTEGLDTPQYQADRAFMRRMAGEQGIDRMLQSHGVIALVAPSNDAAWPITLGSGDAFGGSISTLPAIAGYPHLTVPAGHMGALPGGLSFIGPARTDQTLLSLGFAFEQATGARRAPVLS